ncbi:MAG: hypothetical protein U1F42_02805 [Candidatus Competibacteraceae bacterium]
MKTVLVRRATLTDPITNTPVTGPAGHSLRLLTLPVGSVVTGGQL